MFTSKCMCFLFVYACTDMEVCFNASMNVSRHISMHVFCVLHTIHACSRGSKHVHEM